MAALQTSANPTRRMAGRTCMGVEFYITPGRVQALVPSQRVRQVLYRAPYSDHWETKTLDWALDQIAQRVKTTRDADFTTRDEQGRLLNSVRSIGTLGGATIDNEENYLIKKLFGGGLGVVSIENQARI
jgi:formate dehydrogenase major subunit